MESQSEIVREFAQRSVDEAAFLITKSVDQLLRTMVSSLHADDPVAAMGDLVKACEPFVSISCRGSWVKHVANAKPEDPAYAQGIIRHVVPSLD